MSSSKTIHIVSHDVPYPIDYGGVVDIFCTLQALKAKGISIILHCFEYGRGEQPILNEYCQEVHYYKRMEGHKGFCFHLPYIVASRSCSDLLERLKQDDYPILLQGIHSSFLLNHPAFENRKILLRLFNVETTYYRELAKYERSVLKRAYLLNESRLLAGQEKKVAKAWPVLTLSERDSQYYREKLQARQVHYLPVFHPYKEVRSLEGVGSFCLYHGNLGVAENEKAAIWLLQEVFSKLKIPFVVAGKNPSQRLQRIAHQHTHTCLVANPEEREMKDLITLAQINILPSFNKTGIKLKVLNALYNGRHCITNSTALEGSPLAPLCHIGESEQDLRQLLQELYHRPFTEEEISLRKKILETHFNAAVNADQLLTYLS
ncbi:MAG: mannosyltransferase [Flavihumibacter sp. CACIAM 22H1]|nr:MAG: mannosyltransferase [Flavihumibacter sp. CACIAM 22H1]